MSVESPLPQTPTEQLYTLNEAPTPDNAASSYPAQESFGMSPVAHHEGYTTDMEVQKT